MSEITLKIGFCPDLRYQNLRKSYLSLDIFKTNFFLRVCPKISIFREKLRFSEIALKNPFFAHISENIILTFRGKLRFLKDHTTYIQNYMQQRLWAESVVSKLRS